MCFDCGVMWDYNTQTHTNTNTWNKNGILTQPKEQEGEDHLQKDVRDMLGRRLSTFGGNTKGLKSLKKKRKKSAI